MGLGLVVSIAACSVVERRQQIGVLRALDFQKGMVQLILPADRGYRLQPFGLC